MFIFLYFNVIFKIKNELRKSKINYNKLIENMHDHLASQKITELE